MARRRVKATPNRAWAYGAGNLSLEWDVANPETVHPVIQFADIESDEPLLARETSDYYFERFILWWKPFLTRTSILGSVEPALQVRLGVLNDGVDLGVAEGPEMGASLFDRILQEETWWAFLRGYYTLDGGAISVSTEATADSNIVIESPPARLWDLSSKFSLREDTSLVLQIGSSVDMGASDLHIFYIDYVYKALLRRRKQ